jgi:hypothetical protein
VPPLLRLIPTIGELRNIGRRFENCLGHFASFGTKHWFDLADGSAVYLAADEPPLLIQLCRVGPDLWHVEQMVGPKNAPPSRAERCAMEQKLKDAGIRLAEVIPGYALSSLARAAKWPKRDALDEVDDLENMLNDLG